MVPSNLDVIIRVTFADWPIWTVDVLNDTYNNNGYDNNKYYF